jgi:phage shock protein A
MTDIPKMLRVEALIADEDWTGIYQISPNLSFAAADRIEQLEDTIEVMQHQLKELQWSFDCKDDLHKQDYERMKKYLERIEKLEAALREVLSWVDQYSFDAAYDDHWPAIEELARKAVEGKDD